MLKKNQNSVYGNLVTQFGQENERGGVHLRRFVQGMNLTCREC